MSLGLLPSTRQGPAFDPARELFSREADYAAFVRCREGKRGEPPVRVRVAALRDSEITLRPGTTDARTLVDVCVERYHEPLHALPAGAVILDLGANIGLTALDLAQRFPDARVLAVEMDGANLALARVNTASVAGRVTLVHAAVWSEDDEVEYEAGDEDSFSVAVKGAYSGRGAVRRVPARTVSTLLREAGLSRVDYCKVDIEGAEGVVLAEAPWLACVGTIQVEVHPPMATLEAVLGALRAQGLEAGLDQRHWSSVVGRRVDGASNR